jgi:hypothetical protein
MNQATGNGSRRTIGRARPGTAAVLLLVAAIIRPELANAAGDGGGGGGFHGGGFAGLHHGGFHGEAFHGGGVHGGGFHHGFRHSHGGFGIVGIYAPYSWGYGYPNSSYGYYGNYPDQRYYGYDPGCSYYGTCPDYGYGSRPSARQTWYYCSDPAGYYLYVARCNIGWLPVPAS